MMRATLAMGGRCLARASSPCFRSRPRPLHHRPETGARSCFPKCIHQLCPTARHRWWDYPRPSTIIKDRVFLPKTQRQARAKNVFVVAVIDLCS
uniref:Uncharacterized protein n=1 Tax=Anguilla anguilla TaxID=7936 RepID=A0A0E9PZ86_ANGAN